MANNGKSEISEKKNNPIPLRDVGREVEKNFALVEKYKKEVIQ